MSKKKYGLILSDKTKSLTPTFQASHNVFGNDSDSDGESKKRPVLLKPSDNINRQAKSVQSKAIKEDPTVFQYDEVYESIKIEKESKKEKSKVDKKPRYIENLLKTASKRKIENERRIERQIQKEREEEGTQFADKEVFVTSAYKKKLEEMSLEEEREKREEYLESIGDVTKQNDLGGFYRHLYEQKLGSEKQDENVLNKQKLKLEDDNSQSEARHSAEKADLSQKRNYRKRKSSADNVEQLSEGEIEEFDKEINRLNLDDIKMAKKHQKENIDADSDFSIDDSSDDEKSIKKEKNMTPEPQHVATDLGSTISDKGDKEDKDTNVVKEPKPKIDIWKKRTVGEVFENALKRYYERKSSRSA